MGHRGRNCLVAVSVLLWVGLMTALWVTGFTRAWGLPVQVRAAEVIHHPLTAWRTIVQALRDGPGDMQVDLDYFYHAGRHLWRHGELAAEVPGHLPWYWPFVSRMFVPVGGLPRWAASLVWPAINVLLLVMTARAVGRSMTGLPPRDWPITQIVPVLLALPWLFFNAKYNQLTVLVTALCVAAYLAVESGKTARAGFLLGLAILVKITPAWLGVWLALKRKWRTLAAAGATVVLLGPAADLLQFGPAKTSAYYREWYRTAVSDSGHMGLVVRNEETDRRNQGLAVILRRWLAPTNCERRMWFDDRYHNTRPEWYINVADWPPRPIGSLAMAILGAGALAMMWAGRSAWERTPLWARRLEFAAFLTATLPLMPVLRVYHSAQVYVPLALLMAAWHYRRLEDRGHWLIPAGIAVHLLLAGAYLSDWCQAAGLHWLGIAVLPAVLLYAAKTTPADIGEDHAGAV